MEMKNSGFYQGTIIAIFSTLLIVGCGKKSSEESAQAPTVGADGSSVLAKNVVEQQEKNENPSSVQQHASVSSASSKAGLYASAMPECLTLSEGWNTDADSDGIYDDADILAACEEYELFGHFIFRDLNTAEDDGQFSATVEGLAVAGLSAEKIYQELSLVDGKEISKFEIVDLRTGDESDYSVTDMLGEVEKLENENGITRNGEMNVQYLMGGEKSSAVKVIMEDLFSSPECDGSESGKITIEAADLIEMVYTACETYDLFINGEQIEEEDAAE
jgi:hypothetical protein